ncbi:hypothetical protein FHR22_000123 [Sphingopyxis panaciterrae]|uniref:hypothetical protein n=1 Tax=Sphingopyxis panaciterrae TaxID=363841 RepID=UPI001420577C|nr:hypothetical protein [Sphingopyxis panaciterrae]NIJ35474.1 hypothetical protein [Sphingopyxis panaciterrae]
MNIAPSDLPRLTGASSLSNPGFDIILAVSSARQAMLPTVRMLRTRSNRESHTAMLGALRHYLGAATATEERNASRPVRFFDLSHDVNALPETMNNLFTRGFQPMLNPSAPQRSASVNPIPPDVETME